MSITLIELPDHYRLPSETTSDPISKVFHETRGLGNGQWHVSVDAWWSTSMHIGVVSVCRVRRHTEDPSSVSTWLVVPNSLHPEAAIQRAAIEQFDALVASTRAL
jgi:hypothetical protein